MPLPARGMAASGVVLLFPVVAHADFPSVNTRQFTPPTDPNGSLYLEPTKTPGPGAFNGAAWLMYALRPAVLRDARGTIVSRLVSHQLSSDLVANVGIGERLALGLDVPLVLMQTGDDSALAREVAGGAPPGQAIGDIAVVAKANFISYDSLGGFGLALLLRASAPTAPTHSYVGEGTFHGETRLLAEYQLIALAAQATAGFAPRFEDRDVVGRTYHHEIPWGFGVSLRPQALGWDDKGNWTWTAAIHGSVLLPPPAAASDLGQKAPVSPVVAGFSARVALGDLAVVMGFEGSITRGLGSPPLQLLGSVQWAPREHDQDHDGVPDDVDQCPELPEDRDGFEDQDGCPDWDNDDDGVGDATDRCPHEKETVNDYQDDDGCPDTPPPAAPATSPPVKPPAALPPKSDPGGGSPP